MNIKFDKKILLGIILTVVYTSMNQFCFAKENISDDNSVNEKIASIGFGKFFVSDAKKDIENIFKKIDEYTIKKDFKNISSYISDDFISNDGFDADTFLKSLKNTLSFENILSSNSNILNICVNDDFAIVHVNEHTEAETKPCAQIEGNGLVIADVDVYYYLKRNARKWKIISANVIDEKCSILYGEAKNINFCLNVPTQVKAGCEYTASLSFTSPKGKLILASLSKVPILYPTPVTKEVFKPVKRNEKLERIFKTNTNGYNEDVIASIGLSTASLVSETDINLHLVGIAHVSRRVNIFKPLPQKHFTQKNNDIETCDNEKCGK